MKPPMPHASSISVVDDDESVRESLESFLKSVGFKVTTFESAEEYLESTEAEPPQCLVLDVRLGGMSGPDLQRRLIATRRTVPIVFITAHGDELLRARVLSDGAVGCLSKPFSEEELLASVERALNTA